MRTARTALRRHVVLGLEALMSSAAALAALAGLVLYNGKVRSVDDEFSTAQAVAVGDGRILKCR